MLDYIFETLPPFTKEGPFELELIIEPFIPLLDPILLIAPTLLSSKAPTIWDALLSKLERKVVDYFSVLWLLIWWWTFENPLYSNNLFWPAIYTNYYLTNLYLGVCRSTATIQVIKCHCTRGWCERYCVCILSFYDWGHTINLGLPNCWKRSTPIR